MIHIWPTNNQGWWDWWWRREDKQLFLQSSSSPGCHPHPCARSENINHHHHHHQSVQKTSFSSSEEKITKHHLHNQTVQKAISYSSSSAKNWPMCARQTTTWCRWTQSYPHQAPVSNNSPEPKAFISSSCMNFDHFKSVVINSIYASLWPQLFMMTPRNLFWLALTESLSVIWLYESI